LLGKYELVKEGVDMRRIVALGIAAAARIGFACLYAKNQVAASEPAIVQPFTATVHETRFRPDGVAAHEETYTVEVRSDGSNAIDYHHVLSSGQITEVKMVENLSTGRRVAVDYATESTSTYPLPSNYAAELERRASTCKNAEDESGTKILGYRVVLVHSGHTYENGASNVHDHWEAPELNCFALRSIDFATRKPGVKAPHNEADVVSVTRGEPDSVMFSIPQNFIERSPSQRHAEFVRRYGGTAPTPPQADENYFAGRQTLK
jgi:hypothetical protein